MKTILIPLFDSFIARNIFYTDIVKVLKERDIRLVILPPTGKGDLYEQKFADGKHIFVDKTQVWKNTRLDSALQNLFLQSIPTRFMRIRQVDWYWHQKKYVHYIGVSILRFFGQFRLYRAFIRFLGRLQPIHPHVEAVFDRWQPDAIFAPTMVAPVEVMLMRLAKKRGKKTIGMAKSWDNFSSKAFIRVFPDTIIVHNKLQVDEAFELFDYPRDRVFVSGIPQLDDYREERYIEPREAFCAKLGLDPSRPIILYAPAGDWMNPNDKETVAMLLDWIEKKEVPDAQVLLRLHPAYSSRTEELKGRANIVIERPGKQSGERLKGVEFEEDDMRHLASSLYHSAVTINTASTMAMEAAFLDRPVVLIGFDGEKKLSYWQSVLRYYDREHCVPLERSGGCRLVRSREEFQKSIRDYLTDPSLDSEGRARLVSEICFSADGQAGKRIGNYIADVLEKVTK
jgi:CDP-glycerol glycerophosphotransferase (TagB/SpsB family)